MNNKDILFTFGTLAHASMFVNYSRFELDDKKKILFPLGHVMITIAMFLRTNKTYRKKYLAKMTKCGMAGHTLLFMSVIAKSKFDVNGMIILSNDEKLFLVGQIAMFILYYNELNRDKNNLARHEIYFAYMLLAGFYLYAMHFSENKKVFSSMLAIGILYVGLLLTALHDNDFIVA